MIFHKHRIGLKRENSIMARDLKEKLFEIDSKKIELDFLQKQFLVECKRFTAQSIEGKVRQAISTRPQKVFELGKKGLKPIKEEVNNMLDNVSNLVESIINQDNIWLHNCDILKADNFPENQYAANESGGPEIIEKALLKLLSPIGELLLKHGLDTEENWEKQDNMVIFRHGMHLSTEMNNAIEQYSERFNELATLVTDYEKLSELNSGNDALDLWDSL